MNAETRDIVHLAIEILGLGVSAFVAKVVWDYTRETRLLRLQDAEQLDLLKHQISRSELPVLFPMLTWWNADAVEAEIRRTQLFPPEELDERALRAKNHANNYVCELKVELEAIAYGAMTILFDASLKNYLACDKSMALVSRTTTTGAHFTFTGQYRTHEQIIAALEVDLGKLSREATDLMRPADDSFVVILYLDLSDRVHMIRAAFVLGADHVVRYRKIKRKSDVGKAMP